MTPRWPSWLRVADGDPALTQLGWIDVGLSASAVLGSVVDLGINEQKLQKAL